MFEEIIAKITASAIIKKAFNYSVELLKNTERKPNHTLEDLTESLQHNLNRTCNWTTYLTSLPEVINDKFVDDNHIYLDFYLSPLKFSYDKNIAKKEINLIKNFLKISNKHIVVFGGPGSGKTTSMKMLSRNILLGRSNSKYSFPFVIRFREHTSTLNNYFRKKIFLGNYSIDNSEISQEEISRQTKKMYANNILFILLYHELGLNLNNKDDSKLFQDLDSGFIKNYVINILDSLNCLVILEGFDEIPEEIQNPIHREIELLCLSLNNSRVVITSRTGTFDSMENTKSFEIVPLDENKILQFSKKWLSNESETEKFLNQVKESPFYDTTIRPLNLTFLIALFENNGYLPVKPWSVYKEIVDLLIIKWNRQKQIDRKSRFNSFVDADIYSFLTFLAFDISTREDTSFTLATLESVFRKNAKRFGLHKEEVRDIVNDIELTSGLFVNSGYHKYEFPHKSLQEFLSAEYISNYRPLSELSQYLYKMPNELAIYLSFSNNKNYAFKECVNILRSETTEKFLNRIILEKIDFDQDFNFGVTLCKFFNEFTSQNGISNIWIRFCQLSGIRESCKLLLNFYEIEQNTNTEIFLLNKKSDMMSDSPKQLNASKFMFENLDR